MTVKIRVPFVDYPDEGLSCPEPTLTKQSFQEECDFNNVLAKWQNSGLITHLNPSNPIYADVSELTDYQSSLETIRRAEESFAALPSNVRDRFNNDPAALISFLADPANAAEAHKLGLTNSTPVDKTASPTAKADLSTDAPEGGVNA